MALNFPSNPSNNQIFFDATSGNRYRFNVVANAWSYASNNSIQGGSIDTQVIYNDAGAANGHPGLTFNDSANTLTANTINAYSMRVTGNLYVGSNTVTITNDAVMAQSFFVMNNGEPIAVSTGATTNASYEVANAAFTHSNTTLTHSQNVYNSVNSAFGVINAAFTQSNTDNVRLTSAYDSVNAGYSVANAAFSAANAEFAFSNTIYAAVNSAFGVINAAFASANNVAPQIAPAFDTANAAFDKANSANVLAFNTGIGANNYAGSMANAANAIADATYIKRTAPSQIITGSLEITGNLILSGNATSISTENLSIEDSLIFLATNNISDIVDIGFVGHYNNGTSNVHTGVYRDHASKEYFVFNGLSGEPSLVNDIVPYANNMVNAVLNADLRTSNLSLGGANAIVWIRSAFDTINAAYTSSNADYTLTNAAFTVANAAFGAANSKVASVSGTSGRITSSGGTTPAIDLATAGAGAASYSSGISALTVDAYGRVTSVTGSAGYLTGITSGQVTTALGYTPYNSSNPSGYVTSSSLSAYAPLAGATFTGLIVGASPSTSGVGGGNDAGSMSIRGDGTRSAHVSFHRTGAYAINMGLDTDNVFRIGGWSDGATSYRMQLAAPGGTHTFTGIVSASADHRAPIFYDSNNTARYVDPNVTTLLEDCRASVFYDVYDTNYYVQGRSISYLNDLRPNIIYDRNNTGYYLNPDSTSNMNIVTAGRLCSGYNSGDDNSVQCSNWFRSSGGSGWYNGTYGGGIWMSDSTYIRTYGGKQFYVDNANWGTIFYDSNDSSYYCDPNGTTRLNDFIVKGMWADNVLIADLSGSGASTIESTTCFTSGTYRTYQIQFQVVPGTMSAGIYMQFYVGGAWRTAAGDYRTYSAIWNAGGSQGYGPNSYIDIGCGGRNRNYAGLTGFASIVFPSRTDTMPIMTGIAGAWDSTIDGGNKINFTGLLSFNSAISGFRIYASSGTISGYVKVYGRR